PMHDMHDGWGWRVIQARLQRIQKEGFEIEDVDVHRIHQRFVSLECRLVLIFNIDWFQPMKNSPHSTGAIYVTICNNPRAIRFRRGETILVAVLPGPKEPPKEAINYVLEPLIRAAIALEDGRKFAVYGMDERCSVHAHLHLNASDLPASRKTGGLLSGSSQEFTCHRC
ncbi:hypothetical protein BOTBODRAFT_92259, partial [Botryobasidium botryosum FD-172 SS1]